MNFAPTCSQEIVDYIERTFGVRYSCSAVVKLLKRLGYVYKKIKLMPSKASRAAQEQFVQELEYLLAQIDENEVVYCNDAVHPQHNTRADYGWIYQDEDFEIPANPGRKRVNIRVQDKILRLEIVKSGLRRGRRVTLETPQNNLEGASPPPKKTGLRQGLRCCLKIPKKSPTLMVSNIEG